MHDKAWKPLPQDVRKQPSVGALEAFPKIRLLGKVGAELSAMVGSLRLGIRRPMPGRSESQPPLDVFPRCSISEHSGCMNVTALSGRQRRPACATSPAVPYADSQSRLFWCTSSSTFRANHADSRLYREVWRLALGRFWNPLGREAQLRDHSNDNIVRVHERIRDYVTGQ